MVQREANAYYSKQAAWLAEACRVDAQAEAEAEDENGGVPNSRCRQRKTRDMSSRITTKEICLTDQSSIQQSMETGKQEGEIDSS